ncbi:copine-8 isoform X2 [Folsomia candida]|uniref:copine-8 isoform X2 n=1 Tax=Folsomia candida TaxID=158441 RepID=UPI000B8FE3DA|nr:copine-8 isoform X2 [Folsomia candida]
MYPKGPGYPGVQPPYGGAAYASAPPMMMGPPGGGGVQTAPAFTTPTAPVELIISAKNLLDRDTFSKSDPVCVLYAKELRTNQYIELGRTEQVKNNLSPSWNKKFTVDYRFEERQILKFSIYDWDGNSNTLDAHDFLGSLECSLGEIVAAPNKKFERKLELPPGFASSGKSSSIVVCAEEIGTNKEILHIKMNGRNLDKKDMFGKSDPYVTICKKMDDGSWTDVHKTDVIKNTLNPDWQPFSVRVASLTSGNPERLLRFQVWDWNSNGSGDFIGEFNTTYTQLQQSVKENSASFPAINQKKKDKKKNYTNSGVINVEWLRVEEEKSFLDYIQSGVQLHFTVAVDFTASNGDPNNPQSLHYRHPQMDNQYSLAIKAVGEIIQDYDSDKLFPALGFGARIPPGQVVSHEFFLNGSTDSPFCPGVAGILEAYNRALNTVQLYGPTYFAPIINHVARFASSYQDGNSYFILTILTDGIICDLDSTKDAIINASTLPMSIIIIGVGQEDFSAMEFLDSDGRVLRHNGRAAARDIVQFVEMRKYMTQGYGYQQSGSYSKQDLTRAVLHELPDQLVLWMKKLKPVC